MGDEGGPPGWRWLAVVAWAAATATTLRVNALINVATGREEPGQAPTDRKQPRRR